MNRVESSIEPREGILVHRGPEAPAHPTGEWGRDAKIMALSVVASIALIAAISWGSSKPRLWGHNPSTQLVQGDMPVHHAVPVVTSPLPAPNIRPSTLTKPSAINSTPAKPEKSIPVPPKADVVAPMPAVPSLPHVHAPVVSINPVRSDLNIPGIGSPEFKPLTTSIDTRPSDTRPSDTRPSDTRPSPPQSGPYTARTVDDPVQVLKAGEVDYPEALRARGISGTVLVRFIVNAVGDVEKGSISIVTSPNDELSQIARRAISESYYKPAQAGGERVRQEVEQPFRFNIQHH